MKYIIYKDAFGYHGTDEKNYNSRIRDKSVICDYPNFENAQQVKLYVLKYTYLNENDIVIDCDEPAPLRVCERCLLAIESREGEQITRKIYVDEDNPQKCDWCEESDFDILYEIL